MKSNENQTRSSKPDYFSHPENINRPLQQIGFKQLKRLVKLTINS